MKHYKNSSISSRQKKENRKEKLTTVEKVPKIARG
jgi:hypothetical protein